MKRNEKYAGLDHFADLGNNFHISPAGGKTHHITVINAQRFSVFYVDFYIPGFLLVIQMLRDARHGAGMEMGEHPAGGKEIGVFVIRHLRRIKIFDGMEEALSAGKLILM